MSIRNSPDLENIYSQKAAVKTPTGIPLNRSKSTRWKQVQRATMHTVDSSHFSKKVTKQFSCLPSHFRVCQRKWHLIHTSTIRPANRIRIGLQTQCNQWNKNSQKLNAITKLVVSRPEHLLWSIKTVETRTVVKLSRKQKSSQYYSVNL